MNDDSSLAREATALAISSGWPPRATGWAWALMSAMTAFAASLLSSGTSSDEVKILVLMKPGQIALTRMPYCARSVAATLVRRSEEHTSELQSLMRISYAVFCLKKKK